MRFVVAFAGLALLCACATPNPPTPAPVAQQTAAPAAQPAAAPASGPTNVKAPQAKQDCRRVRVLGSIKYKEECVTHAESEAATKAGKDSRDAARAMVDRGSLPN